MLGQSEKSLPDLNNNIPIPIYRITTKPEFNAEDSNAGLWYDKFCDTWLGLRPFNDKEIGFGDEGKRAWIEKITKDKIGNKELLKEMLLRREELTNARNGKVVLFQAQGPFVTGLGRTHPVENGFSFHHTLGVPYLAGSSVKGLVRAWAEHWTESKVSKEYIKRIFGDNDEGVGSVIFLDALPLQPVELKMDIMTPHYSNYYKGEEVPGDWDTPNPISFMVVKEGQRFQFCIIPRRYDNEQDKKDCEQVLKWLEDALSNIGAGAKTAVGYGRFEKIEKKAETKAEAWIREAVNKYKQKNENEMQALTSHAEKIVNDLQKIAEPELRRQIKEELIRRYKEGKAWDYPTGGLKKAKKILEGMQ